MIYACDLCFPGLIEIAEIGTGRGCWLVHDKGRFAVLGPQGHKGHELFFFPDKPTPDPDPECNGNIPEIDSWFDQLERLDEALRLHVTDGYWFVRCCLEAGWGGNGLFSAWLMNWCGLKIAAWETEKGVTL